MISYFVSLLALMLIQITHVTSQELSLRRVKFDEFDRDEREFLANLNRSRVAKNWLGIELNDELTDAAQQEAERLATLARLELPRFNLANSYYGFSFKLNGKIANIYVGYQMCHNNMLRILDLNVYSPNIDCSPSDGIDYNLTQYVGVGRAYDRWGNLFTTRLFFSSQKRHLTLNQDVIVRPQTVSLEQHDEDELAYIDRYNMSRISNGSQPIFMSAKVRNAAQNEAKRLADLGHLDFPKSDLRKSYYGASFKITGKIDDIYVGFKICYDNIVRNDDKTIYYMDDNCFSNLINETISYYVGFGSALDSDGNIFKVRIFSSSKKDSDDKKKKRKTRNKHRKNKVRIFAEIESEKI